MNTDAAMPHRWTDRPKRTVEEALHALVPDGADFDHLKLVDAARGCAVVGSRTMLGKPIAEAESYLGKRHILRLTEAARIVTEAVGEGGPDRVAQFIALHRNVPLDDTADEFIIEVLVVAQAGLDPAWGMRADLTGLTWDQQVRWVGQWDAESLTECLAAGFTGADVAAVLAAGQLPDPDALPTMRALHSPT